MYNNVKAFAILWVDCECHKNPLFEGVAPHPWGVLQVLKNPAEVGLPLWRVSCNLTGADSGLDLAMEDKALHVQWVALLAPQGQGLQHEFQVTPDVGFLLSIGAVTVCACSYCYCEMQIQGLLLLAKGLLHKVDCA